MCCFNTPYLDRSQFWGVGMGNLCHFNTVEVHRAGWASPVRSSCTNVLAQEAGSVVFWSRLTSAEPTIAASACLVTASTWLGDPMPNPQAIGSLVTFRNSVTRASTSGAALLSPVMPARANRYTNPRHESRMLVKRDPVVASPEPAGFPDGRYRRFLEGHRVRPSALQASRPHPTPVRPLPQIVIVPKQLRRHASHPPDRRALAPPTRLPRVPWTVRAPAMRLGHARGQFHLERGHRDRRGQM